MDVKKLLLSLKSSIRDAIKLMDSGGIGIVFVIDLKEKLVGVITDGDFRRAILKGIQLDQNIERILNRNFAFVNLNDSEKIIINTFLNNNVERLPVLEKGSLVDVLFRENYKLEDKIILPEKRIDIPIVIMAGGKGTRMAPFTHILPKPLIPIGKRSMLEVIMDEYLKFGFDKFYLTVNYKANLIKAYFKDFDHSYNLSFIKENKFLGTAGALKLLKLGNNTPIFVSNCDILIKESYLRILDFHKEGNYDLTIVAAMVHHQVPYGVCKIKDGGELIELSEKPEYDYLVNSGMYIVNSVSFELIPNDEFFHITHLMDSIKENGGRVGVYPVSEKSWIDVGQWDEYNKARTLNDFS